MRILLAASAVIEAGAGTALLCAPSATVALLIGAGLDTPATVSLGRLAGAALLTLGVACWLARQDFQSRSAIGLVGAMMPYNFAAVAILAAAGIQSQPVGVLQWPAVALHAAMGLWCVACLLQRLTAKRT
jgi:hypothetical protein